MDTKLSNNITDLIKFIQENPLPFDKQEAVKRDGGFWCLDYWTLEVLKFLLLGEYDYMRFPPPRRLVDNPLFIKENIVADGKIKLQLYNTINDNKTILPSVLYVCEVGWGIDIVIANSIRDWDKIICYDSNKYVLLNVYKYFSTHKRLNIETYIANSGDIDYATVKGDYVLVANHFHGDVKKLLEVQVPSLIIDGKIVNKEGDDG